jgi:hypothetical protein
MNEIPDELATAVLNNPESAGEYRKTLALAAKQLDIAQRADSTADLAIHDEDGMPLTLTQQRLRARLIQLEALTWGAEKPREEIRLLIQATEVDPTFAPAFHCLGLAHFLSRNRAAAIAALETGLALEPDNIDVVKLLDRARNMTDAEIATFKLTNAAAKTAAASVKTWTFVKIAWAVGVPLTVLLTIASFTGSIGTAFLYMVIVPPFLWLFSHVLRFINR